MASFPMEHVHDSHVRRLVEASDWSGLVRYWMAHLYDPALQEAIRMLQQRAASMEWRPLVNFLVGVLRQPIDPQRTLPDVIAQNLPLSEPERKTLEMLALSGQAALCEIDFRSPPDQHELILQAAIRAAELAGTLAGSLREDALMGFFLKLAALGYVRVGQLQNACEKLSRAAAAYCALADNLQQPFLPYSVAVLHKLADVQEELGEADLCRRSLEQAVAGCRGWVEFDTGATPLLAHLLTRLGKAFEKASQAEASRASLAEATALYRTLAEENPSEYLAPLADALVDLGRAAWSLREHGMAADAYSSAVDAARKIPSEQESQRTAELARALSAQGELYLSLGESSRALECLSESVSLYRILVERDPPRYTTSLAFTLSDLGKSQFEADKLPEASATFAEAAELARSLVQEEPENTILLLELATALNARAAIDVRLLGERVDEETVLPSREVFLQVVNLLSEPVKVDHELSPQLALALENLGEIDRSIGDLASACSALEKAADLYEKCVHEWGPHYLEPCATSWFRVGCVQRELGRLAMARSSFMRAVAHYRESGDAGTSQDRKRLQVALSFLGEVVDLLGDEEAARTCFEGALEVQLSSAREDERPADSALDQATALINLGNIQRKMKDHRAALDNFSAALSLLMQYGDSRNEHAADLVATALIDTGGVFMAEGRFDLALSGLEQAVEILRKLARRSPRHLAGLAVALMNLGSTQSVLGDAESARKSLQESLIIRRLLADQSPQRISPPVATTLISLAGLVADTEDFATAESLYEEAIRYYAEGSTASPSSFAQELFASWNNLSRLYLPERRKGLGIDFRKAHAALRKAVHYAEISRGRFFSLAQRRRILGEAQASYQRLIEACLELWKQDGDQTRLHEAVEVAEASRARLLTELLADEESLPAKTPRPLAERYQKVRQRLRLSEGLLVEEEKREGNPGIPRSRSVTVVSASFSGAGISFRGLGSLPELRKEDVHFHTTGPLQKEVERLQKEHRELLERIRRIEPNFDPNPEVAPADYSTILSLLPAGHPTAIVQYVVGSDRGYALVITREECRAVELPALTLERTSALARNWQGTQRSMAAARAWSSNRIAEWRSEWDSAVEKYLGDLAAIAVEPILHAPKAPAADRWIIAPHRSLHGLPLHACRGEKAAFLIDEIEIVYAPSLSILHACRGRKRKQSGRVTVVENPTGDLPFTEVEGNRIASYYREPVVLRGSSATRDLVLENLTACELFHYAGHAKYDANDPLSSALVLESMTDKSKWLTLRDLFSWVRMEGNWLTVLSGCETGLLSPDVMDEHVSLPLGFLHAGSLCVIASLWEVDDLSTALVLERFHASWSAGRSPGAALCEAQLWLRKEIPSGAVLQREVVPRLLGQLREPSLQMKCREIAEGYAALHPQTQPFASPLHWAAFVVVGVDDPIPDPSHLRGLEPS